MQFWFELVATHTANTTQAKFTPQPIVMSESRNAPGGHLDCTWKLPTVECTQMHLECAQNAPGMHPECTRNELGMHPECTRNAPGMHLECTRNAPGTHLEYTWNAPGMHPECTQNAPRTHLESRMHLECTWNTKNETINFRAKVPCNSDLIDASFKPPPGRMHTSADLS